MRVGQVANSRSALLGCIKADAAVAFDAVLKVTGTLKNVEATHSGSQEAKMCVLDALMRADVGNQEYPTKLSVAVERKTVTGSD